MFVRVPVCSWQHLEADPEVFCTQYLQDNLHECVCAGVFVCVCLLPIWLVRSIYLQTSTNPESPLDASWTKKKEQKDPKFSNGGARRQDKICYNKVSALPVMLMNHTVTLCSSVWDERSEKTESLYMILPVCPSFPLLF